MSNLRNNHHGAGAGRNYFHSAEAPRQFFATERNKVRIDPKYREGDIPILVVPALHEMEKSERTPRGDKLTLPAIVSPRKADSTNVIDHSNSSSRASAFMMSTTPQQGHAVMSARSVRATDQLDKLASNLNKSAASVKNRRDGASTARTGTGSSVANYAPSASAAGGKKLGPPMQLPRLTFKESDIGIRGIIQSTSSSGPHMALPPKSEADVVTSAGSLSHQVTPTDYHRRLQGSGVQHAPAPLLLASAEDQLSSSTGQQIPHPPPKSSVRRLSHAATKKNKFTTTTTPRVQAKEVSTMVPQYQVPALIKENHRYLRDYDGGQQARGTETEGLLAEEETGRKLDEFELHQEQLEYERAQLLAAGGEDYHTGKQGGRGGMRKSNGNVATIDEEASVRVLKAMFQLDLTRNSFIIKRLKECDQHYLNKRVMLEVGHRKTLSREEFHLVLCRVLKDDFVNRRDANTLFSVFDSDKSGLVDASEFINGLLSMVSSGVDDIAYKFINTLLDGREKSTANAFISRFELDVLIQAAQRHYERDAEVVSLIGQLSYSFNFSHHQGRIPVLELRQKILEDDDYRVIFENLPNPTNDDAATAHFSKGLGGKVNPDAATTAMANNNNIANNGGKHSNSIASRKNAASLTTDENEWMSATHIVADQYMHPDLQRQQTATETDHPEWWTKEGTVYRKSESNPYEEAVFFREK